MSNLKKKLMNLVCLTNIALLGIVQASCKKAISSDPKTRTSYYKFNSLTCNSSNRTISLSIQSTDPNPNNSALCHMTCLDLAEMSQIANDAFVTFFNISSSNIVSLSNEPCEGTTCYTNNIISCSLSCSSATTFGADHIKTTCN